MPVLKAGGKIFAADRHGELVVRLPRERVDGLVAAGAGKPFEPLAGPAMKEWVLVEDDVRVGEALVRGAA